MSVNYELNAEVRNDKGKGASRRLRRENKVPGIIYGGGKDPVSLVVAHDPVMHSLENEAFYSSILDINIGGKVEKAVLKDLQRHPYKNRLLHLDLLRISATEKLRMQIPLHFIGEDVAPGVKQSGGIVSHLLSSVEISCFPKDLPEYLEVDLSGLELNDTLHLSDIKLGEGVEIVELMHGEEHDQPVASIHLPRAVVEVEEVPEAEKAAEGEEKKGEGESS